jgi:hypothetical protein
LVAGSHGTDYGSMKKGDTAAYIGEIVNSIEMLGR